MCAPNGLVPLNSLSWAERYNTPCIAEERLWARDIIKKEFPDQP